MTEAEELEQDNAEPLMRENAELKKNNGKP
jgi:hypothetical protein